MFLNHPPMIVLKVVIKTNVFIIVYKYYVVFRVGYIWKYINYYSVFCLKAKLTLFGSKNVLPKRIVHIHVYLKYHDIKRNLFKIVHTS